jgi:kynurenine formamidase
MRTGAATICAEAGDRAVVGSRPGEQQLPLMISSSVVGDADRAARALRCALVTSDPDGERRPPAAEFDESLRSLRNWGRWGTDDQRGAVNLIDAGKVTRAAGLVRLGITVSMARELQRRPAANNPRPVEYHLRRRDRPECGWGTLVDHISYGSHGSATTHVDALCHMWNRDGMWNGRDPDEEVDYFGARWGGIEQWSDGIVTRGVLLDVAATRPGGFVEIGAPVTGDELAGLASGLSIEPGDALVINCGREAWEAANGRPWASGGDGEDGEARPGLDASCLRFFRDVDCSMIVWDIMDVKPNAYALPFSTHAALFTLGVALVDNAFLGGVAQQCRASGRTDFLVVVAPLPIVGGTGCPVNPLAVF